MAFFESSFKVHYIGIWNEDTFTDDVIKQIAAHSKTQKGKKVKLTLNNVGIKFSKYKIFQQQFIEFYPYDHLKAVTKNPCYGSCIMFIFGGREKKHRIIVIKCPSDSNSIYIVNRVSQYQQNYKGEDVEFKKRENGNWTLRERSAHNANMHLKEIFKENQETSDTEQTAKLNGDIHHVPVLDKSKEPARTGSYIKKNGEIRRGESIVVQSDDHTGEVHVVTDDGIRDAEDLKALMDHVKVADVVSGSRRGSFVSSQQPVNTADTSGPLLLRAVPKTYDARIVTAHPSPYYDQWAAHRRVSGDFVLPARLDRKYSTGTGSTRSSMRVQFDSEPVVTVPRKTMSMRIRPVTSPPPHKSSSTTIQRRIEDTYARPVIIQEQPRRASGGAFVVGTRSRRPSSIHVMSGNELRVYQHETDLIL